MSSVEKFEQVTVSGRVRTADGGSIPGAAVTLADMSGRQVAVAQTDTAGQYRLAAPGAGSYLVIVSAPGHQPAASVLTAPGAGTSHDIVLRGGSGLAGTVRAGGSGQPVSGATVTVANARGEIAAAATTGPDGSYRLSQLAEGQYTLVVAAAAYAPLAGQVAVEEGELVQHDVELPASGRVIGTVLSADGDQPFAGAQVTLTNEVGTEIAATTADPDGNFTLSDVPSGRYTLVAGGYRPGVATLPAGNGRTRQADITLTLPE
jgi:Carboxypeptidase regulatory-like domain